MKKLARTQQTMRIVVEKKQRTFLYGRKIERNAASVDKMKKRKECLAKVKNKNKNQREKKAKEQ